MTKARAGIRGGLIKMRKIKIVPAVPQGKFVSKMSLIRGCAPKARKRMNRKLSSRPVSRYAAHTPVSNYQEVAPHKLCGATS